MVRKVISIICYVISGVFLYAMSLVAFVNEPPAVEKFFLMAVFFLPALIALGIGLALRRFQAWKRDVGIVLASASGVSAFVIFSILCILLSPESREFFPEDMFYFFSGYRAGLSFLVICGVTGFMLIMNHKKEKSHKTPPQM